jgi:hypothetical protein
LKLFSTSGCGNSGASPTQRRIAAVAKVQRVLVALARHAEIVLDERDLVRQQRGLALPGLDRVAQHVGEALAEPLRRRRVRLDQVGERVQRVEQEVRLHLRLQRAQLRARRGLLHLNGAALGGGPLLGELQVVEADARLPQQRAQLGARVVGHGFGLGQVRGALVRPGDLHRPVQPRRCAPRRGLSASSATAGCRRGIERGAQRPGSRPYTRAMARCTRSRNGANRNARMSAATTLNASACSPVTVANSRCPPSTMIR